MNQLSIVDVPVQTYIARVTTQYISHVNPYLHTYLRIQVCYQSNIQCQRNTRALMFAERASARYIPAHGAVSQLLQTLAQTILPSTYVGKQ